MKNQRILRHAISTQTPTHTLPAGKILLATANRMQAKYSAAEGIAPTLEVWIQHTAPDFPNGQLVGEQTVHLVGTGTEVPAGAEHATSTTDKDGTIWHLYTTALAQQPGTTASPDAQALEHIRWRISVDGDEARISGAQDLGALADTLEATIARVRAVTTQLEAQPASDLATYETTEQAYDRGYAEGYNDACHRAAAAIDGKAS